MAATHFESTQQRYEVGKYLSRVLRELAPSLGLHVDDYGWVQVEDVVEIVAMEFPFVRADHLHEVVEKDPQRRFGIEMGKIRANAGHRFTVSVPSEPTSPPERLYHGTASESAIAILREGLRKMGKAYVHLASTTERATRIGLRKSTKPVLLVVHARRASESGIKFWKSGQVSPDGEIYLAEEIPPEFITQNDK